MPQTEKDIYWQDFGSIKDSSGIMIGMKLAATSYGNVTKPAEVITKLNELYPNGLTGDLAGKIVIWSDDTRPDAEAVQYFYAYDYDDNAWFYVGTLGQRDQRDVGLSKDDPDSTLAMLDTVSVGGLLFKKHDYQNISTDAVPKYWSSAYNA